ncbi:tudor domain-containing protein 7A-like isoform X1 [Nerophis ophidion]|uniref:tudor domain-containing protein 7A-like isoform X1 n=1 Tax=Nerophis ophidion TaxID=159077 RepID=UPI002AE03FEE|nr:tudor domain-containing protein 7A-like isoform X1 [Nerophis ophidion]XP_061736411.1 tudor domain-containing protein 7A-like isoform X1 [Nerophis ophidion]
MSDSESVKKMLRSVLQSSKQGVYISKLQSEYRSLCGENIPLKKLGFSELECYLMSIPSVVRLDYQMGELRCFAAVCKETAHIAELVARQKTSKKSGRSQVVNCRMRRQASNSYMLKASPMSSLRQPSVGNTFRPANHCQPHGGYRGFSASGDIRQLDNNQRCTLPVEHRQPSSLPSVKQCVVPDRTNSLEMPQKPKENPPEQVQRLNCLESCQYDVKLVQRRLTQLLEKYNSGMWKSKLPTVFSDMFNQQLPPQALTHLEKWKHICVVEQSYSNTGDCLIYPPLPSSDAPGSISRDCSTRTSIKLSKVPRSTSLQDSTLEKSAAPLPKLPFPKPNVISKELLAKPVLPTAPQPANGHVTSEEAVQNSFAVASINRNFVTNTVNLRKNSHPLTSTCNYSSKTNLPSLAPSHQPTFEALPPQKYAFSSSIDSGPCLPTKSSDAIMPADVWEKVKELLSKYSSGLWVHALPKLYMDTYKAPLPEHLLDKLCLLCTVEYPFANDKEKAILYYPIRGDMKATDVTDSMKGRSHMHPSGVEIVGPLVPPCLVHPSAQYPSVLVTDAKSSNAVTIRYVGEGYSFAQEAMEDAMLSFYKQSSTLQPLSNPVVGQLIAVKGDDGNELARAQVTEVMALNKVKVYYVDYGVTMETTRERLLDLHQNFLLLPFQATHIRLAGLEAFSTNSSVLSSLCKWAIGKILLMEFVGTSPPTDLPEALLYDTSQEEDININSICLKDLQDETMNNPLTVNCTYPDVCVTNVSADGDVFCQLPSRGTEKLSKLLEDTDAFFMSEKTSEYLLSKPFNGKACLIRYQEKWSRAEITNLHGNRVVEVSLVDLGVPATVEITELREIPPLFIQDFTVIPPLAIKCRLADVTIPAGDWSPDAVLWLKNAILGVTDCKMKICKLEEHKGERLVHIYLFVGAGSEEVNKSINHQLTRAQLLQKLPCKKKITDTDLSDSLKRLTVSSLTPPCPGPCESSFLETTTRTIPPPLQLPLPGQNLDVYVPVACHPSYFVIQPWQDLHKLGVLMGEMMLYYNQTIITSTVIQIKKGEIYAGKIQKNWHRVVVKGILSNGLISVYELDYGKHELILSSLLQPLIEEFRQLPFQAVTARLAGVPKRQWSEEASMVFRNHVEQQALVAQIESVQDSSEAKVESWERTLTVYLVDTKMDSKDIWIHSLMADVYC